MINILHLTHTDIESDSRILKEMQSIASANKLYHVSGIGVIQYDGSTKTKNLDNLNLHSIKLLTRQWKFLPKVFRHTCSLVELTAKMVVKAIRLQPKIIHCHDTLVLPLGVIVKLLTGAKLIYDAHELESNRNGLTKILSKMTLFVEKLLWRFINELIVVSPSIAKWYENNIGEKETYIILNSPILENLEDSYDKDYLRNKFSIPKDDKIFIYIGGFVNGRGLDLLVESFKQSDVTSHLVLLGYGQLQNKLTKLANKYTNIHVHSAVPHEDVISVAKGADVGLCFIENVSLSDYYCLPNKLFEYSFSGLPILTSDFPDLSQVVHQYNLGKCCDLSFQSVKNAILEFEKMDEIPKIDTSALHNLSWKAQEEKLHTLYDKILDFPNPKKSFV